MANRGQRRGGQRNGGAKKRERDNEGVIPVLAKAVREVEARAERGQLPPQARAKFQVVALLVREERTRVRTDPALSEAQRAEQMKRLDGVATILAKTATRDTTLLSLLAENATVSDGAKALMHDMLTQAGVDPLPDEAPLDDALPVELTHTTRRVVPQSVTSRMLANPFQRPDFTGAESIDGRARRLSGWELLGPLFRSFEYGGGAACMQLPDSDAVQLRRRGDLELMPHQAQLVESAAEGHRSYLLADEPGLGKTAQALLAAQAIDAFPLLAVVPNVVKTNWAREAGLWTPNRTVTVVQGDGHGVDGYADIVIVNYEILDRHVGWLGEFGVRGMVVDEAHFIKNKQSLRSQNVLHLSERIRARTARPLLMALTGTPLINDIEDFQAIWEFLGWINDKMPLGRLMDRLEETGLTPADAGFYPAARASVVDMGIVRRRKVDVAADIPARRIADIPVELDEEVGRSIREAERELARHLLERYDMAIATRRDHAPVVGIDHELVRRVAGWELAADDSDTTKSSENVFTMVRRIGQAKAGLAADYAAQLARNVGKVVFFAKHIDVMDIAGETFAKRGLRYTQIRGDQTPSARQRNIDEFVEDPDVSVIVCSLMAAGVGLNLQVSSNVVLAELSWTNAEQTQAIDRVHRIGQDMPVTAWRIIAAQTIDTRIAEVIDAKAGLAARALDGSDEEVGSSADVQLEALVTLLTGALEARG